MIAASAHRRRWSADWSSPLALLLREFWQDGRASTLALLATLSAGAVIATLAPVLLGRAIDMIATDGTLAFLILASYALATGAANACERAGHQLSLRVGEHINLVTSTGYFQRLTQKTDAFFLDHNAGELATILTRAQEALRGAVLGIVSGVCVGLVRLGLTLVVLGAVLTWSIAGIVAAYGVVLVLVTLWVNRRARPSLDSAIQISRQNASFAGNAIAAMETMRYFRGLTWMSDRYEARARETVTVWDKVTGLHLRASVLLGGLLAVQMGLSFLVLLPMVERGAITLGDLVLFNLLLIQLALPFQIIGRQVETLNWASATLRPFLAVWQAAETDQTSAGPAPTLRGQTLEFRNVSYTYPTGAGLPPVSLIAHRGQLTFLTGPSGAGKSTALRLALKSMEPDTGTILVDGVPLQDIPAHVWFQNIAVVLQDPVLLNQSMRDNILLGRPCDDGHLAHVLDVTQLTGLVGRLGDGLDTIVGERGGAFSGGERQRIALARALYGKPKVLFLDEASAALDEPTERAILDHLRGTLSDCIVFAITHRLGTIGPADTRYELGEQSSMSADTAVRAAV